MDGVKSVKTDLANKLATCTVEVNKFDVDTALAALDVEYGPRCMEVKK